MFKDSHYLNNINIMIEKTKKQEVKCNYYRRGTKKKNCSFDALLRKSSLGSITVYRLGSALNDDCQLNNS